MLPAAGLIRFFFFAFVLPLCAGVLPALLSPKDERTVGKTFLYGQLLLWTVFDLIAIPVMLFGNVYLTFETLCKIVPWVTGGLALAGLVLFLVKKPLTLPTKSMLPKEGEVRLYWGLFFLLVCIQLYMAYTHASFDGDDAYYVVESVLSEQTGTMYHFVPYTGETTALDIRHALAIIPVWEAYLARMSGLHAAIVAHTLIPLLILPLAYYVLYLIAKRLLHGRDDLVPVFLIISGLILAFGNTSIYTAETFLMTRTWQGKAMMAGVVVPMILMVFCTRFLQTRLQREGEDVRPLYGRGEMLIVLMLIHVFAGMCTSMGVVLAGGLVMLLSAGLSVYEKKVMPLCLGALSCLPGACYLLLYLRLQ